MLDGLFHLRNSALRDNYLQKKAWNNPLIWQITNLLYENPHKAQKKPTSHAINNKKRIIIKWKKYASM